jgi:hypothetical protein
MKEVEANSNSFAPNFTLKNSEDFSRRIQFVGKCLYSKYYSAHEDRREKEMEEYSEDYSWAGPAKFTLPIEFVNQHIPNMKILQSIENALCNICEWPNARNQAFQIKEFIKYGAENKLYTEVAQIGDLVAKIAKEKPYGDQTIGTDLLRANWIGSIYWNGDSGNKTKMNELFKRTIGELTDFADGKYEYCITDYPMEPFWIIKNEIFSRMSSEDKIVALRGNYPILLERPDLVKKLGISIS